jgi:hypothetical protein
MSAWFDDPWVYLSGLAFLIALVLWPPIRRKSPPVGAPKQRVEVPSGTASQPRAFDWGETPPPPQRRAIWLTPDGRDKRKMMTAEYHALLREKDPNKENLDYPPTFNAYRDFYRNEWVPIRWEFKAEIETIDPMLWRCWADRTGKTCWGKVNVDHIYPVELFWSKRSRMSNFQCLCERHNERKGNSQPLDYRPTWLRERYPD